eukprot:GHVL01032165.1.p1 GENE.GHVL01032165.1~~GHVL01032165.1.p1  ORF type:complete len:154 (-),score=23.87 GHVL01032165.1:360-788(-)
MLRNILKSTVNISKQQFFIVAKREKKTAKQWCNEIFDELDLNKDGYLQKAEVNEVSKCFGESTEQREKTWETMLNDCKSSDGKDCISKDDYVEYWKSQNNTLNDCYKPEFEDCVENYLKKLKKAKTQSTQQAIQILTRASEE